ncbi:P-type conjugative transfer protein TrbG [Cupriavidus gilardii]|nr:P-type conjugative transfer protein TrbG [Cupriavidus gilardii]
MRKLVACVVSAFLCTGVYAGTAKRFLTLEDAAVAQAKRWQQTGQAKPIISDDGRVMYPYGQYLPKLTCTLLRVCDIQLEPGEIVTGKPVAGDNVRWKMSKQISGSGDRAVTHIIVKPIETNIATNMIITTDRRAYQIELYSSPSEKDYVNMIGFYYPEDIASEWDESARLKAKEERARQRLVAAELPPGSAENLDFSYDIDGSSDTSFKPLRVYNNGQKVYLQMPESVTRAEAPVLMRVGKDGRLEILNWRAKTPTLYEVDSLFDKALLIVGSDGDERKITITWTKNKRGFFSWGGEGG